MGDVTVCMQLEMETAAEEIEAGGEEYPIARPDDGVESEEVEGSEEIGVALDKMGDGGEVRPSNDGSLAVTVEMLKDA